MPESVNALEQYYRDLGPATANPNFLAQGRRANVAQRSMPGPTMQAANTQLAKELASMGNRGAVPDLINRGLIANTAGLPVDMLNTVLQTLGLGSEQPLGGSDSIRRALEFYGLSSETQRPMLETLASLTPPRAVMGAARVAGQGAGAVGRAATEIANAEMAGRAGLSGQGGAITYHGTPHRFPPTAKNPLGEFDPMKIGTGEGAQAYGVGAGYLAEAKDLAKHYRDVLAIDPRDSVNSVRAALSPTSGGQYWKPGENKAKLDDIYFEMKRHPNLQPYLNNSAFQNDILKVINGTNPDGTVTDEAINILRRLDKTMPKPSGQLYKVDLADEQIPKMLDWDKPLSQQAPEVQKALSGIESKFPKIPDFNLRKWMDADPLASTWHNALQRDLGVDPAMISNTLKERGITGIRYLDAGSRTAGEGTSNFVVFDPKHMNIIGRE